jgi:hypothetical protein
MEESNWEQWQRCADVDNITKHEKTRRCYLVAACEYFMDVIRVSGRYSKTGLRLHRHNYIQCQYASGRESICIVSHSIRWHMEAIQKVRITILVCDDD